MSFFTRQRCILLLAVVMAITAPVVSYAQLGALKEKAVETLTNGVMKELEKKFTDIVAKEAISAAAKEYVVKGLSELSRPIVKNFIDNATSGKLPSQTELVNSVLKGIIPRVPELIAAATEGVTGSVAQAVGQTTTTGQVPTAGQVQAAVSAQLQNNYDDEKDFSVEIINESNTVRITRYTGKSAELRIPPRIGDRPVAEIGERVFMKKGLTSVVIPESVVFIGNMAFAENPISSISIGANVYITNNAFDGSVYNPSFVGFYNTQGRKAAIYSNSWRIVSGVAPQPVAQQARPSSGSTASAGTTVVATPASTASAVIDLSSIVVISPTSGWTVNKNDESSATMSIDKEQIDGRELYVLNIDVYLKKNKSGWCWADANFWNENGIQNLKNANGVRFKALGDGKKWQLRFITSDLINTEGDAQYEAIIQTQKGKVISFDIPYKRLKQPDWGKKAPFIKNNILGFQFQRSHNTGTGPATIKVFDFEIY